MQLVVRRACTMIAAAVQGDVDGITQGSHYVRVTPVPRQPIDPRSATRPVGRMDRHHCAMAWFAAALAQELRLTFGCAMRFVIVFTTLTDQPGVPVPAAAHVPSAGTGRSLSVIRFS